jgi:uncharacterized phage protein (TIGR02218 family)
MSLLEYENSKELGSRVELYLFESDDGRYRWAYTTGSDEKTLGPIIYKPEAISRSKLKQTAGDSNVEKLSITVPFDNPVAALHVPYLPPRPIRVTVYAFQRNDPAGEIVQGFTGYVTSFNQKGAEAVLECSQILDNLSQTVPWAVFKSGCIWGLYQVGCGVDKALWREDALITMVDGATLASPEFSNKLDGWYTNGFLVNPATGEQRFITEHNAAEGTIKVVYPFLAAEGGQIFDAFAGCARTKEICSEKFGNKINYVGFDHRPDYNVFQQGLT